MGAYEAGNIKTLKNYKDVEFTLVKQHRGKVGDSLGDNLLPEFMSIVDAVQCAVAIEKELQLLMRVYKKPLYMPLRNHR